MSKRLQLKNGSEIVIAPDPFASGGEGNLHHIIAPSLFKDQVAKIYKPEKRTKERERKIEYLVTNPPKIQIQDGHHPIIWINQMLFDAGKFVGFVMYQAKGEKLEYLCHPKLPPKLGKEWSRFDFQHQQSVELRKRLCFNIAAAIFQIHSLGNYVIVDMKPDNIMVQPNGLISLIDIDSIEVIQSNKVMFPAPVATPEYIPPEYYKGLKPEKELIPETWDRFSLGVIFYRLLNGIHPFVGTCHPPFENITDSSGMIEKGLFPHGRNRDQFRVIPPPHNNLRKLGKNIQDLFINCFDDGHVAPVKRPSAGDWCQVFSPRPVIKINRILPSQKHKFDGFLNSESLSLEIRFYPIYIKPQLLGVQKAKGIPAFFDRLFGASGKINFINQLVEKENSWKIIDKEAQNLIVEINNLNKVFQKIQNQILEKELQSLSAIKAQYQNDLALIDTKATKLFQEEQSKLGKLEQEMLTELSGPDIRIRQYHATRIQPIEQKYTSTLNAIQQSIASLMNQEAKEISNIEEDARKKSAQIKNEIRNLEALFLAQQDTVLNAKLKEINTRRSSLTFSENKALANALEQHQSKYYSDLASQFMISVDAYSIFHDQYAEPNRIVNNLANYGIRTAADFSAVDTLGQILTRGGKWVKVPQVGVYRAERLESWRISKLRNMSASIPQSLPLNEKERIIRQFKIEFEKLDREEKMAKEEALRRKSNVPESLVNQKVEANKKIHLIDHEAEKNINQVKMNFSTQRQNLSQQYNKLQKEYSDALNAEKVFFDIEKTKATAEQEKIRKKFEIQRMDIQKNFDPLHSPLFEKAEQLSIGVKLYVNRIKQGFYEELLSNHRLHIQKYHKLDSDWKLLKPKILMLIDELKDMQSTYNSIYRT